MRELLEFHSFFLVFVFVSIIPSSSAILSSGRVLKPICFIFLGIWSTDTHEKLFFHFSIFFSTLQFPYLRFPLITTISFCAISFVSDAEKDKQSLLIVLFAHLFVGVIIGLYSVSSLFSNCRLKFSYWLEVLKTTFVDRFCTY